MPRTGSNRFGVRVRATVSAVLVVALALVAAAVALVWLLGSAIEETVSRDILDRAQQVAADLSVGDPGALVLRATDDGIVVQVLSGRSVVAATPGVGDAALSGLDPRPGQPEFDNVDGTRLGEPGDTFRVVVLALPSGASADRVVAARSLASAEESQQVVGRLAAFGIPALLLIAASVTWVSLGRALRPVEAIRARTAAIGGEDLAARVPVPASRDEIAALARTMNAMLGRLQAAAATQRAFVSDAGHELRSPIAAIRTEAEVARRSGPTETTFDDLLAETVRLEGLVEGLILLARFDEGALRLDRTDVDLDDLLDHERVRIARGAVTVVADLAPARVSGDPGALSRVLRNVVDNAVRHARTQIRLSCGRLDTAAGGAWLEVSDDGPGVPLDQRDRVLERFVRLDEARARDSGGSGLGLAIAVSLVRAHGGRVALLDPSPPPGLRVRVELPAQVGSSLSR